MRASILSLAVAVLACITACSSSEAKSGGTVAGGACVSGAACAAGSFCKVTGGDPTGVCAPLPAACTAKPSCIGECGDALQATCAGDSGTTGGYRCSGTNGSYSVGCSTTGARAAGQSCSQLVQCVAGLFCDIKNDAVAGTCAQPPAACGGAPDCDCLRPISDACPTGHSCSSGGGVATVACH